MSENKPPEANLADEFRQFGKNLTEALRAALQSPESKRLQQEITTGLGDLGRTLEREANNLKESPAGKQFRSDVEDLKQRMRTGEVEAKVRDDLTTAMRSVNDQLRRVVDSWESRSQNSNVGAERAAPAAPASEQPPESPNDPSTGQPM